MARDFDGTNDSLLGTNQFPTIAGSTAYSMGGWFFRRGTTAASDYCFGADASTVRMNHSVSSAAGSDFTVDYVPLWSGGIAQWTTTNRDGLKAVRQHVMVTYNGSSTANDPVFYVNGASVAITENISPSGTFTNSDTDTIRFGERLNGSNDYDGQIQHWMMRLSVLGADEVNRAMWWGRPGGGLVVYYPFVTDKLVSEGIDQGTLTASGTTVAELPTPTVRPGSAMMGMGIGW